MTTPDMSRHRQARDVGLWTIRVGGGTPETGTRSAHEGAGHGDVRDTSVPPRPDVVLAGFPEPPGLYLHVPFCTSICPFCPYNKVRYDAPLVERYFAALGREVDLYARGGYRTVRFGLHRRRHPHAVPR